MTTSIIFTLISITMVIVSYALLSTICKRILNEVNNNFFELYTKLKNIEEEMVYSSATIDRLEKLAELEIKHNKVMEKSMANTMISLEKLGDKTQNSIKSLYKDALDSRVEFHREKAKNQRELFNSMKNPPLVVTEEQALDSKDGVILDGTSYYMNLTVFQFILKHWDSFIDDVTVFSEKNKTQHSLKLKKAIIDYVTNVEPSLRVQDLSAGTILRIKGCGKIYSDAWIEIKNLIQKAENVNIG